MEFLKNLHIESRKKLLKTQFYFHREKDSAMTLPQLKLNQTIFLIFLDHFPKSKVENQKCEYLNENYFRKDQKYLFQMFEADSKNYFQLQKNLFLKIAAEGNKDPFILDQGGVFNYLEFKKVVHIDYLKKFLSVHLKKHLVERLAKKGGIVEKEFEWTYMKDVLILYLEEDNGTNALGLSKSV